MSTNEKTDRGYSLLVAYIVGGTIVPLLIGIVVYALATSRGQSNLPAPPKVNRPEESLENAREALARSTDLNTCKTALLQHVRDYLGRSSESRSPPLSASERDFLKEQFQLNDEELSQLTGDYFIKLDAHHLDLCFLLRDALRSLLGQDEPSKAANGTASPEQVAAAFAWVVRQVQLFEQPGPPVPPQFILRRGWGTSLERALIFLAMLQQLDILGCLVVLPGNPQRLWACGALVERDGGKQLLLFDPRLGLPLSGPKGEGIATLAQLRAEPDLLKQLTVDPKHPYDITPEQVKQAEVHLFASLASLPPRWRHLQQKLQDPDPSIKAPVVQVNLATDAPDLLRQLRAAVGEGVTVKVAASLARVQRHFLPPEEGGIDQSGRLARFRSELVPWYLLPPQIQNLEGEPGLRLQNFFGQPFMQLVLEPGKPRDLVLRGQFTEASLQLVSTLDEVREHKAQGQRIPEDWQEQMAKWRLEVNAAHSALIRAQREAVKESSPDVDVARAKVKDVWQGGQKLLAPLLLGRAAEPRSMQLTYLLALCKLEQAEQLQARLNRLQRPAGADKKAATDREAARKAWRDAAQCWESFANEHPDVRLAAPARRLHARTRTMLGEQERAATLLEDLSGELTPLEKTAHLYLARQLRSAKAAEQK